MKLIKGQQFKTKWGIWVYQGLTNSDWKCQKCSRDRKHCHEFLGYTNPEVAKTNPGGFNYHALYGTECVKDFLKSIEHKT